MWDSIRNRLLVAFASGTTVTVGVAAAVSEDLLEITTLPVQLLILGMIQVGTVESIFALLNVWYRSRLTERQTMMKNRQARFVQQLKAARDVHTLQVILDRMMDEDLLRGIDLSATMMPEVHLEGADLAEARLEAATLRHIDLESANLRAATLIRADMKQADLENADLNDAQLQQCHLTEAYLNGANLRGAFLQGACLKGASLHGASLEEACLNGADLRSTCLLDANLTGASVEGVILDETTILPNGENWIPSVNLNQFTQLNPTAVTHHSTTPGMVKEKQSGS